MIVRTLLFPFLLLTTILACQSEAGKDGTSQINRKEVSFVMLEVNPKSTGDMVRTLKLVNERHGYVHLRMSSTTVHSNTGDQDFLIVRGFQDFNGADAYVELLDQQRISGSPFAIPQTQYKECMVSMDFNQYRREYLQIRQDGH